MKLENISNTYFSNIVPENLSLFCSSNIPGDVQNDIWQKFQSNLANTKTESPIYVDLWVRVYVKYALRRDPRKGSVIHILQAQVCTVLREPEPNDILIEAG